MISYLKNEKNAGVFFKKGDEINNEKKTGCKDLCLGINIPGQLQIIQF